MDQKSVRRCVHLRWQIANGQYIACMECGITKSEYERIVGNAPLPQASEWTPIDWSKFAALRLRATY